MLSRRGEGARCARHLRRRTPSKIVCGELEVDSVFGRALRLLAASRETGGVEEPEAGARWEFA